MSFDFLKESQDDFNAGYEAGKQKANESKDVL